MTFETPCSCAPWQHKPLQKYTRKPVMEETFHVNVATRNSQVTSRDIAPKQLKVLYFRKSLRLPMSIMHVFWVSFI
ncbi:unnamed protein product [Arctogadus glacialis]